MAAVPISSAEEICASTSTERTAAASRDLRSVLALDFDCLLVGDGAPILEGAKARLGALVTSILGMRAGRPA